MSVDRLRRTLLLAAPTVLLGGCAPRTGLEEPARALNERLAANDERSFLELFAATEGAQATGRRMFAALSPGPTTIEAGTSGRLRVTWGLPGEPSVVSEADLQLQGGQIVRGGDQVDFRRQIVGLVATEEVGVRERTELAGFHEPLQPVLHVAEVAGRGVGPAAPRKLPPRRLPC